jgi:hypothetical protein
MPRSGDPKFTMRFHPSFDPGIWLSPNPEVPGKRLFSFCFIDADGESSAYMDIACLNLHGRQIEREDTGLVNNLSGLGKRIAESVRGTFDGERTIARKGRRAGEICVSGKNMDRIRHESTFGVMRSFIAGDRNYLFSFFCYYPSAKAEEGLYTALDNPIFKKYGLPALDSVTFSD